MPASGLENGKTYRVNMRKISILLSMVCLYPLYGMADENLLFDISTPPVSVDVTFVATGLSFGTRIDNSILEKIGCKYEIHDPINSLKLLELTYAARNISQDAVDPKQKFEIRNKLIFHFQENDDVSVEFSQKFANSPYLEGNWNSRPLHLKSDLAEQIHEVVKNAGVEQLNKNAPKSCDRI